MIGTIITPENYTPEIKTSIQKIKNRMHQTLVNFMDEDIKVFEYENSVYILANPILGEEPIFDNMGNFQEMIPMYNLTIIQDEDWLKTETDTDRHRLKFIIKIPRLRILRPDLCDRIIR